MNKIKHFLLKPISKVWKIIKTNRIVFVILFSILSVGTISFVISLTQNRQNTVSKAGGSGKACEPANPLACEFFEQCSTDTKPTTCQFNPNWRSELTAEQKVQLREAFGAYGLDLSLFATNPLERLQPANYISIISPKRPLPDNWHITQDTISKAIYATYPYLSDVERKEIVDEFEISWGRISTEGLMVPVNGIMTLMDIASLPETLGTLPALRRGALNLLKNPKQIGNIFVKLQKIPEVISLIKEARSPARLAALTEIDNVPALSLRVGRVIDDETHTLGLLEVNSKLTRSSWGRGYSAPVQVLTDRVYTLATDAQSAILRIGGKVDYRVPIEVAATRQDFERLIAERGASRSTAAFYDPRLRKIFVNPDQLREPYLYSTIAHEVTHQVNGDAGFPEKVSRYFRTKYDTRVVEGWTEYVASWATNNHIDISYEERVNALKRFFNRYIYDYLDWKRIPNTAENRIWVRNWLRKYIYDYTFSNSIKLEDIYDKFYGKGKFGELLRWYFKDISYSVPPETIANENRNLRYMILSFSKFFQFPQAIAAAKINCCYDWPDEGELKKPFIDALQTSRDLNIPEWDTESFEALLKLEWLKNRLNENQKLTYEDFKQLSNLDFKVEVEKVEKLKFINTDDLPGDSSNSPFTPSPSFVPGDDLAPPDISPVIPTPILPKKTQNTDSQTLETIIGNCNDLNAWVCEWPDKSWKNCLDTAPGNQSLFNDTYYSGELMWKYQAAQAHGGDGSVSSTHFFRQLFLIDPHIFV